MKAAELALFEKFSVNQELFVATEFVGHEAARNEKADEILLRASSKMKSACRGVAVLADVSFDLRCGEARGVAGFLQAQFWIPQF